MNDELKAHGPTCAIREQGACNCELFPLRDGAISLAPTSMESRERLCLVPEAFLREFLDPVKHLWWIDDDRSGCASCGGIWVEPPFRPEQHAPGCLFRMAHDYLHFADGLVVRRYE